MPDVVVAGYLGVDIAPGFAARGAVPFSELFRPGKLIETRGLDFSLGGVVANTGLAMKRFGCDVALMGCVGEDALGDLAIARLGAAGVHDGIRRVAPGGTAYGIVLAPPGVDRMFLEDPGCNRSFTVEHLDLGVVRGCRLFHFGYPPLMEALWRGGGSGLRELLAAVRACGPAISLDMALPDPDAPAGRTDWAAILADALPFVDIFTPSIEELLFMLDSAGYARFAAQAPGGDLIDAIPASVYDELADRVLAFGVKVLLIKAGPKGAYLRTAAPVKSAGAPRWPLDAAGCPDGRWLQPMPVDAARVCNASGAGDCAIAGFLSALLKGKSVVAAGHCAMTAGRDNLYGPDALSGLRPWEAMVLD